MIPGYTKWRQSNIERVRAHVNLGLVVQRKRARERATERERERVRESE
jgi:hypothetical protein